MWAGNFSPASMGGEIFVLAPLPSSYNTTVFMFSHIVPFDVYGLSKHHESLFELK